MFVLVCLGVDIKLGGPVTHAHTQKREREGKKEPQNPLRHTNPLISSPEKKCMRYLLFAQDFLT